MPVLFRQNSVRTYACPFGIESREQMPVLGVCGSSG